MLFGAGIGVLAAETITPERLMLMEQYGLEFERQAGGHAPQGPGDIPVLLDSLPDRDVLLITDRDLNMVGAYEPFDGIFIGWFITDSGRLSTPINAMEGPDHNIYVSDQISDGVFVYDRGGNYLYTYVDASDSIDNARGIDFRDNHLFVATGARSVLEFAGPHNLVGRFLQAADNNIYAIYFLPDGTSLVSSWTNNQIKLYNTDGSFNRAVITTTWPEQTRLDVDSLTYLTSGWSSGIVTDFDFEGNIQETTPIQYPGGNYRLGNGNLLISGTNGIFEITPGSGAIVNSISINYCGLIELVEGPTTGETSDINLTPSSFTDTVQAGGSVSESLLVANLGAAQLIYGLHGDQTWINASPDTGNVPGAARDTIIVVLNAASLTPGSYGGNITVVSNDPDEAVVVLPVTLVVEEPSSGCQYVAGDINGNGSANGIDVTFGVAFFKGGTPPPIDCNPPCVGVADPFYAAGDVNGNCAFNGIDITFYVAYLKGLQPALLFCQSCPPPARN
jgi:WD40 repeat protein